MSDTRPGVLLDTCALIWLVEGALSGNAQAIVVLAAIQTRVFVSPVSAWEVGMLANPRGNRPALKFTPNPNAWFSKAMSGTGVVAASLTPDIAIDAAYLPGDMHHDPADRLLVATARHLGVPIMTSDTRIIAYARQGFVQVVPC